MSLTNIGNEIRNVTVQCNADEVTSYLGHYGQTSGLNVGFTSLNYSGCHITMV